ncbi:YdhK family protein [Sporosarcina cascadiensis]|uniref:YdhK family protein n=1 Tax=Sporosarcina cascadiensis TaxID=2660747 RepID=UPI00129BD8A4|nr:YdhK family protein [Sporosarcina cascadiensis]
MKKYFLILSISIMIIISGCGKDNSNENDNTAITNESTHENMDMEHSGSGEVPDTLKAAENPTYKVGSNAIIKTDHMEGMKDAEATIVGAYDTVAYSLSYTPTTGGKRVENHKWVIQEELKDAGDKVLDPGSEAIIEADHMKGMKGATGVIDSSKQTTVYMIDYTPTTGGERVTNHKWVTDGELSSK